MRRQTETKWILFLLALVVSSFGMLTGFVLNDSMDITMHDTYFVMANLHLLSIIAISVSAAYLLTLGLKKMAGASRLLRMISIVLMGFIGLGFLGLLSLSIGAFWYSPSIGKSMSTYGMILLIAGLLVLFVLRTKEIIRIK